MAWHDDPVRALAVARWWSWATARFRSADGDEAACPKGAAARQRQGDRRFRRGHRGCLYPVRAARDEARTPNGQLMRAAVELAKDWRTDKFLRNLEAMMIVADKD